MDDSQRTERARSFGDVAEAYAANRPDYPVEAVRWLVPDPSARVLELGAGTGKLTETLVAERHRVTATDPDRPMLDRLRKRLRTTRVIQSGSEQIPVHAGAVDVVIAAQAFHWFDHGRALPEIARV
ncbi:MAG TPA: class I SAM-dependent methyltransferase, partial [Nocardioidaceae bacterium]|nr:class I SAM-dependent methyltransferase [Nocardioidaceae bacterium]